MQEKGNVDTLEQAAEADFGGYTSFAASPVWDLQRRYFEEMGMEAWRIGEVPHYVTSNPRQANGYAEMAIALYKDHRALHPDADRQTPIHIIELGAGSGRLAYYVLRRLEQLCAWENIPIASFFYILTDFTQGNLDFWQRHPRFATYFEAGILDMALLDVSHPGPLHLQLSDQWIEAPAWDAPIVVVANYLFDSVPQELLYVEDGHCQQLAVAIKNAAAHAERKASQILETMELDYAAIEGAALPEAGPIIQGILADYARATQSAFILFPLQAIHCLEHLRGWSQQGLLLLTADKGGHRMGQVCFATPPGFANHGSISMHVNYHALVAYCAKTGGLSFFPDHLYASVNTGSLCFLQGAGQYRHTIAGSYKHLQEGAPDNYFTVYRSVRTLIDQVQIGDILAALRLSLFDSHQLGIFSHRIAALLPIVSRDEAQDLLDVMARCWENYFALQEETDLATVLGSIAYSLDAYEWALYYFGQSTDIYGGYTGTFYNIAVCHHMLGNAAAAIEWLQMVIAHDPQNAAAVALLADYALQPVH